MYASRAAYGVAGDPLADETIVAIMNVRPGRYRVSILTKAAGTLESSDADNVRLTFPGGTLSTLMMGSVDGMVTVHPEMYVHFLALGSIAITAISNASLAGANYRALMVLTPDVIYE